MVRDFSASGEYAALRRSSPNTSPDNRRGLYTSIRRAPQRDCWRPLMSAGLFPRFWTMRRCRASAGGWLPFLAAPLGLIGLYIRLKLEDAESSANWNSPMRSGDPGAAVVHELLAAPDWRSRSPTPPNARRLHLILSYMPTLSYRDGHREEQSVHRHQHHACRLYRLDLPRHGHVGSVRERPR